MVGAVLRKSRGCHDLSKPYIGGGISAAERGEPAAECWFGEVVERHGVERHGIP